MKRKFLTKIVIFCIFIISCYYINLPDYYVRNSMSFSNQGTRDTELTVIGYKHWKSEKIIRDIEAEHNKINGIPSTLKINFYYSTWHIRYGEQPFKSVIIEYDNKVKK